MKVNKRLLSKFGDNREFVIGSKTFTDGLLEVLKEDLQALQVEMRSKASLMEANWQYVIASQLGEERRLQSLIEMLTIREE